MKNLRCFLLIAVLATLISCSNDDTPQELNSTLILGEWNLEEISYSGSSTVTQGGQTLTSTYTGEGIDLDARVIFNDATNYTTEGNYTIKLITTVNGQTMEQNIPYPDLSGSGTYRIEGNKIFTTSTRPAGPGPIDPMATVEGTIIELTSNRMAFLTEQQLSSTVQGAEVEIENEMLQVVSR